MAKKKKKQNPAKQLKNKHASNPLRQQEEAVRRVYHSYMKDVNKRRAENQRFYGGVDYDPGRVKRRITATAATMEEFKSKFHRACPTPPEGFDFETDWTEANATPRLAYDMEEEFKTGLLGATIWMLDVIRDRGDIQAVAELLPDHVDPTDVGMPDVWDPCHGEEMLLGMLSILQNRNADCVGLKKAEKNTGSPKNRYYLDSYTAENLHKQEVPSRIVFEKILGYIPQAEIDNAVELYMGKYWDVVDRYYKSRIVYAKEEADVRSEIERFNADVDRTTQHIAKTSESIRSMIQIEKPVIPSMMNGLPAMLPQSQMNAALTTASKYQDLIQTTRRLQEAKDELDPFALENQILTIPQIPFQYSKDFADIEHIEAIQGVTNSNRDIVFLGCEVLGHSRIPFATEIKMSVLGYILLSSSRCTFDRIDFYSEAINGFYSPRNAYDVELNEDRTGIVGIKVRNWESYKRDFQCLVNKEVFQLGLNVYLNVNLAWEKEQLGTAKSIMSMSFADKKKPNDILDYYLYVRDFLEFVNFQKCIPLERIELFEKSDTGKYERRGKVVIFQADSSEYVPSILHSITFIDVTSECFPILFSQIVEKRLSNNYNPFFYPESRREDRVVDTSKWLNTAICFEGEFNTFFPEYRAKNDSLFHDAKTLLLDTINSAVQKSGKSINNKQNNALKSFKSLIDHADTTIKQKFEVCMASYEYEMSEAIHRICSSCGVPEDADLAGIYASYRNQTAHGVIRRPEDCDVATYRILRGFIYVMNLKRANIPADRIKEIIGRMF